MTKLTRKLTIIGIGLLLLLILAWHFGNQMIVEPYRQTYQSSSSLLNEQEALLIRMQNEDRSLQELEGEYEELQEYLPVTINTDQMVRELDELAEGLDVDIERITKLTNEATESVEYDLMQVEYHVDFSYQNIQDVYTMIEDFTEMERIIELPALDYAQSGSNDGTGSFTVRTYYQGMNQ